MEILLKIVMFMTAMFLVVLILLQRGRGGGLAGALGGAGGQSAFGSKAGDVFTRITSGVAIFWIVLCVFALGRLNSPTDLFDSNAGAAATVESESLERGEAPAGDKSNGSEAAKGGTKGGTKGAKPSSGRKAPSGGSSTASSDSASSDSAKGNTASSDGPTEKDE
jgi:preprotein translocase subunit SecG